MKALKGIAAGLVMVFALFGVLVASVVGKNVYKAIVFAHQSRLQYEARQAQHATRPPAPKPVEAGQP